MATNQTTNYQLNQWEPTDAVQRTDFNTDNAKVDAALDALAGQVAEKADGADLTALEATVAGHTTQLGQKGNCQFWTTSYVGSGETGFNARNRITFPKMPYLVLIQGTNSGETMLLLRGNEQYLTIMGTTYGGQLQWEGSTLSWKVYTDKDFAQFNSEGVTYLVLARVPGEE